MTAEIIQTDLINKLKQDNYSFSTIHKVYVLLNQCLKYAVDNEKMIKNPCSAVKQPSKKTFDRKEIRFLNEDEIKLFIKQALSFNKVGALKYKYGIPITLVIYTGLRCGELAALKWNDIDFENKIISVSKNIATTYDYDNSENKKRIVKEQDSTKTSKGRLVHMNKQSLLYLEMLKNYYKDIKDCNYIINNSTQCVPVDTISDSYTTIANACGIVNPLGIHTLRHTCASLMIKKGVDIKIVSEILGHRDVAFTYNTYVHIIDEQKIKALDMIDLE